MGQNATGRQESSEIDAQTAHGASVADEVENGNRLNCDQGESSETLVSSDRESLGSRRFSVQASDLVGDWDDSSQRSEPFKREGARVPVPVADIASRYWGDEGYLRTTSAAPSDRQQGPPEMPAPQEVFERAAQFEGLEGQARPCSAPSSNVRRSRPVNADDLIPSFDSVDDGSDSSFLSSLQSGEISEC